MRSVLIVLCLTLLPTYAAQDKPRNADIENIGRRDINAGNVNFTSLADEVALGRRLATALEQQAAVIDDSAVNSYVDRIAQNLAGNSDTKVPITVKVLKAKEINSVALPGGFIYVNTGAILAAENEAELAAIMAYAIAHVAARHGTENAAKGTLLNTSATQAISRGNRQPGIPQAAQLGSAASLLRSSRQDVEEADYLGIQYLYKAGYNPNAAVTMLQKLQAEEALKSASTAAAIPAASTNAGQSYAASSTQPSSLFFRTHPETADRIENVRRNIVLLLPQRDRSISTDPEFEQIKMRIAAIK